jgi:hypothetical protein
MVSSGTTMARVEVPTARASVFDTPYGPKTFRFGGGVDEAEASQLIELLKSRYPFASDPAPQ